MRTGRDREPDIGAADQRLLAEPLDFLETEHYRQRALLQLIERIIPEPRTKLRATMARAALDFVEVDLALNIEDEKLDLIPLLRQRCLPADGLERILSLISRESGRNAAVLHGMTAELASVAGAKNIPPSFSASSARFVESLRRMLGWEDSFVLPLARRRLTEGDRCWLSDRMIERRKRRPPR